MKKLITVLVLSFVLISAAGSFAQISFTGSIGGGVNFPVGVFSDMYKSGFNFEASYYYPVPVPGLSVYVTAGYTSYKYKNDYFTNEVFNKLGVTVDGFNPSWSVSDVPVHVGIRYSFPAGFANVYGTAQFGLHFMNFSERFNGTKITASSSNPTTVNLNGVTETASETMFGGAIGAGIIIPLVPKVSIDINARYAYGIGTYSKSYTVFRNSNSQYTAEELKNPSYASINGGIVFGL